MGNSTYDLSFNFILSCLPHCSALDSMAETISYSCCAFGLAQIRERKLNAKKSLSGATSSQCEGGGFSGPLVDLKKKHGS